MENPALKILPDEIGERLDELALIAAAYKHNRDEGRPTTILRRAFLAAADEAVALAKGQCGAAVDMKHGEA